MEVYIEYLIVDNFLIDYMIIFFTQKVTSINFNRVNKIIATCFGVVGTVFLPLISINVSYLLLIKILIVVSMVLILKKYANFRQFLVVCIVFFTVTFLFGGVCVGVSQLLGLTTKGGQVLINGYNFIDELLVWIFITEDIRINNIRLVFVVEDQLSIPLPINIMVEVISLLVGRN